MKFAKAMKGSVGMSGKKATFKAGKKKVGK